MKRLALFVTTLLLAMIMAEGVLSLLAGRSLREAWEPRVATPSWNHRAAAAFLLDHWNELAADIVVHVPCNDDLADLNALHDDGWPAIEPDPSSHDPWLEVRLRVVRLQAELARRGARLLPCWFNENDGNWLLGERLPSEVDFVSGRGLKQVIGGLNADLTARTRLLVLPAPGGGALQVELKPPLERPDLYPLHVDIDVDGQPAGRVLVPPDQAGRATLPLPPRDDPERPLDVRLTPADVTMHAEPPYGSIASFRPLDIGFRPR